jgi:hypothetical protein
MNPKNGAKATARSSARWAQSTVPEAEEGETPPETPPPESSGKVHRLDKTR